ncbi:MAG: AAA family ATPase [Deltaproteobacteria bacterium]|jgi:hypothetical protein|nr:AAA family ATPase [Deltaproteobacteria bacterium]
MLKLPSDGQDFVRIRSENYLYVDKTKAIQRIIGKGGCYFLSRPRRFGKSLLIGAMKEILLGHKDLFEGLWIATKEAEYQFKPYPVVKISLVGDFGNTEFLTQTLIGELRRAARENGLDGIINGQNPSEGVKDLIATLYETTNERVAVLIDEYDGPIISQINDIAQAEKNRDKLAAFCSGLKACADDGKLHLLFVTGVTKFARASLFSAFNNLNDLTLSPEYGDICGFTRDELDNYFEDYLPEILDYNKSRNFVPKSFTIEGLKTKILDYYDGYSWDGSARVINPYTLINFLNKKEFNNYWHNSGVPSFLFNIIKNRPQDFTKYSANIIHKDMLDAVEIDKLWLIPLLFQTGYLTVDYRINQNEYMLKIPNVEVESSFNSLLVQDLTKRNDYEITDLAVKIGDALIKFDSDNLAVIPG